MLEQVFWMTATDITRALMFALLIGSILTGSFLLAQKARIFHTEGMERVRAYESAKRNENPPMY